MLNLFQDVEVIGRPFLEVSTSTCSLTSNISTILFVSLGLLLYTNTLNDYLFVIVLGFQVGCLCQYSLLRGVNGCMLCQ